MTYPAIFWVFLGIAGLIVLGPLAVAWFMVWRHDDEHE